LAIKDRLVRLERQAKTMKKPDTSGIIVPPGYVAIFCRGGSYILLPEVENQEPPGDFLRG